MGRRCSDLILMIYLSVSWRPVSFGCVTKLACCVDEKFVMYLIKTFYGVVSVQVKKLIWKNLSILLKKYVFEVTSVNFS